MMLSNSVRGPASLARLVGLIVFLIASVGPQWAHAVSTTVVISEFRTRGPGGGNDEFVELYNLSANPVNIGGWKVNGSNAAGTASTRVTIAAGIVLNPGCRYLVTNSGAYSGAVAGNQTYGTGFTDDGGVALLNAASIVVDAVGMSTGSAYKEGATLTPTTTSTEQSQERLPAGQNTQDTDNNVADFALNTGSSNPQNAASACTPLADIPPTVSGTIPANAATGIAATENVVITFSEPVTAPGGAFAIACASSGTHTFSLNNSASTVFTLNPDADFAGGEVCTVTVTAAAVTDQDGTPNAMAADHSFSFTTAPAVVGACGSDHRLPLAVAPSNLCATGTPSAVSGSGPWTWSCSGSAGSTPAYCGAPVAGTDSGFSILHVNDTHARLTPHKWLIPSKALVTPVYEDVGGAAHTAGKMLSLAAARPTNSLVIDAGDISEGNPVGDIAGDPNPVTIGGVMLSGCAPLSTGAISSNCGMTQFYQLLSRKLLAQRGRGMDAVVVGNHDVRDAAYVKNLENLRDSGVPVLSVNIRDIATHQPHFAPYTVVTIDGQRVGILGYTTQAAEVGASLAGSLEVVECDWTGSAACHLSDYVNELRAAPNNADVVILVAHVGHGALVDQNPDVAANLLVDDGVNPLPEIVVTGHWHTWAETAWTPMQLNYKTLFTESSSYFKYIGQLNVDAAGKYLSNAQHVVRNAEITPDADAAALVAKLVADYNATHTPHVHDVVGYTADNLVLDNDMRWWSPDEYPWSGNNTAGQWITDAMQWKCAQLFGACDLAIETGGGVRSDIPAGPVTMLQVYETFPWSDDTFVRIDMSGQDIINFLKEVNLNAGFSRALHVTAVDGVPTQVLFNGAPIDVNRIYTVSINNYMYAHPPAGYVWPTHSTPLTNSTLMRDGIIEFMQSQHGTPAAAYTIDGPRYQFNGEFSGGYRGVVTMISDQNTRPTFDTAFVRFIGATPETLARRGGKEVPADLVNADGSINGANRLSSMEIYRSYLGFKPGALVPGDIVELWGKASFYGGNPEFVDQEGIYVGADCPGGTGTCEFKIVGHDAGLAKPEYVSSIGAFLKDDYKNRYVRFLAKKTAADTVVDQNNQSLKIWDKTGYAAASLPGNVNDVLAITGVLAMENYGFRLRSDSAVVSTAALPSPAGIRSSVDSLVGSASAPITLNATASIGGGGYVLTPVADSQVASGYPTNNYGSGTNLYLQSDNSGYGNERAWLRFDLSAIPAGSTINGATLRLWNWKSVGAALPVELRSVADDSWLETGLTWNNQPTLGTVLDTQTLSAGTSNVWYSWNALSFVQSQFAGDKTVSLMLKPVTESSADATAPSYAFDAREYGSSIPELVVTTQATATSVASVRFFYRYSADNSAWGAWTQIGAADTTVPYGTGFSFPNGYGYYEFYSVATDNLGGVEPTPAYAQTGIRYQAASGQAQTISFPQPAGMQVGSSVTLPTATATSGLAVVFNSLTTGVCTVSGSQVTAIASGTCTIAADQAGAVGYWLPAPQVTRSFTVARVAQGISFAMIADHTLGDAPFAVSATASSGLTVTIVSQTVGVCTISGDTVTLVAAGTCTLAADQAGDATYEAAATVTRSFQVSSGGGISSDGDVPLPAWALVLLGVGLLGAMRRAPARR